MELNLETMTARELPAQFLYGLRVEVRTTKELQSLLRYLERKMPHWRGEKWDYKLARPLSGVPAVGLASPDSKAIHIIDGCVTVCYLVKNEDTITYSEFDSVRRRRGKYRKRGAA